MWKYCGRISQLRFFILSFHSPPHTCPLSPFFYFFFSSRTFQQHLFFWWKFQQHLICSSVPQKKKKNFCSSHQRKGRDRDSERGERLVDRRSPCCRRSRFTMPSEIGVHHALPRPPSHRRSSSSLPPGWVRSACSFFFFFIFACSDSTLF